MIGKDDSGEGIVSHEYQINALYFHCSAYYAHPMKHRIAIAALLLSILGISGWNAWRLISAEQNNSVAIGGDFMLTDTNNKLFDSRTLRGRYMLVYFGYSFCPDICPTELQRITNIMNELPPSISSQITPIFITTDPERDTPEALKEYIAYFHPSFMAFTGTSEQIKDVTKKFGVYVNKAQKSPSDKEYLVDHSGFIYFMDTDGKYVGHFARDTTDETMLNKITSQIK